MFSKLSLTPVITGSNVPGTISTAKDGNPEFGRILSSALQEVNRLQHDALNKASFMVTGESMDAHDVMLAIQKAELALELTQSVRNKVIESYQEIMRMQV